MWLTLNLLYIWVAENKVMKHVRANAMFVKVPGDINFPTFTARVHNTLSHDFDGFATKFKNHIFTILIGGGAGRLVTYCVILSITNRL